MKKGVLVMGVIAFMQNLFAIDPQKYEGLKPVMKIEEFFNGKIKAWGIVQDRSGNILSKFDVDMVGTWNGNKGKLEEEFHYYDTNKKQHRTWEINKLDEQNYTGSAGDIEGTATGSAHGNAINWHYEMYLPVKDQQIKFKLDDWMWAMNNDTVINRSYIKKFGIKFAEITIFMKKDHA